MIILYLICNYVWSIECIDSRHIGHFKFFKLAEEGRKSLDGIQDYGNQYNNKSSCTRRAEYKYQDVKILTLSPQHRDNLFQVLFHI